MKTSFRFAVPFIVLVLIAVSTTLAAPIGAPALLKPEQTRTAEALATQSAATPTSMPQPVTASSTESSSTPTSVRRPFGIYAVVRIIEYVAQQKKAAPSITPAQLDTQFDSLYQGLLANPAISGLTLQVQWNTLNPNPPSSPNPYFWNYVDDAFSQVAAWNSENPTQPPKTIQLIVSAGYNSPQWLLDQLPSCDGLFASPVQTPPSNCGKVTFNGYDESGDTDNGSGALPLPWNPAYKSAWQTFLTALAARYENPAFVSIAVAGPTAASAEITTASNDTATKPQTQFGTPIAPNDMWLKLLAFAYPNQPTYQNSDQAFIDQWDAAIDLYGQIFSGVTLVATTGAGLPNFNQNSTIASGFSADCSRPSMECAAVTQILSHFVGAAVGGANAKSTQTSGMKASHADNDEMGVAAVRSLAQSTAALPPPSAQILGGAQFDTSFSRDPSGEGCTSKGACTNLSPEQAEYNVLKFFFDGTPVAASFGGTAGSAPLNYLQIYDEDIQYATAHANAPVQVTQSDGSTTMMSAQDLLNLANQKLAQIEEDKPSS